MENYKKQRGVTDLLKKVPLLKKLSDKEIQALSKELQKTKVYKDGQAIITQGEPGNGFFMIQSGQVDVTKKDPGSKKETHLATLNSGDFFGETALINNAPRGATVSASGSVQCFYLDRESFTAMFGSGKGKLNVQFAKRKAISAETAGAPTEFTGAPKNAITRKTAQQKTLIRKAVKYNVLFMKEDDDTKDAIIDEMYLMEVEAGKSVITQGALGDNFYVVQKGVFGVYVSGVRVATRGEGTCFGELALMYNSPRAATVTASTDAAVWVVDRFTFRRVVTDTGNQTLQKHTQFLSQVDLLAPLSSAERQKIAEALDEVEYGPEDFVFKEGADGDAMYLIQSGTFAVIKKGKDIGEILPGGFFGERALIKHEPRAATIKAKTASKVLRLDATAFSLLLGPLEDIMREKIVSYDEDETKKEEEAPFVNLEVDLKQLKTIGVLGRGSFGYVKLVEHMVTGETYALKAVNKTDIVATGQQVHIMNEKKVMMDMNHPFLVKLHGTFKDADRLYFLMEPSLGGELFSVLREKTLFDEDTSKFYAGCVISGFEYIHSKNYVYRDLKPENLLLDPTGYIKITDFGFAKDITSGRTWTLCGTPDYLAPEIVSGKGHGKAVDWWTVGVFIFEMLASYPPFFDEDPMKTYAKIMHGTISFPSHFSKESVSIIKKLLQGKPTRRLGVIKGGAKLIKKHPWFRVAGTSNYFEDLLEKKLKAPCIPVIKDKSDLTNFDDYEEEKESWVPYVEDGTKWDAEF